MGETIEAWNAGFNADDTAYVENKGWKNSSDMMTSYKNLEKLQGGSRNMIEMLGVDASNDEKNVFYNKLGRPETAEKYSFEIPDGGDTDFFNWFRNTAHAQGMTDAQAKGLMVEYDKMNTERAQKYTTSENEASEKAISDLKQEWGKGYDTQIELGRRAVSTLGYDEQGLTNLEANMGTSEMLKLFANLGSKMGEDSFEDGSRADGSSFGGVTPEAAKQQVVDLKADPRFMEEYLKGNPDAVAKMTRLMKFAHPGK